jgi:hypothetical protein
MSEADHYEIGYLNKLFKRTNSLEQETFSTTMYYIAHYGRKWTLEELNSVADLVDTLRNEKMKLVSKS